MHKTLIPRTMIFLLGLLTVICFFLPFAAIGPAGSGQCLSMFETASVLFAGEPLTSWLLAGAGLFGACTVLGACLQNATLVILSGTAVAGCFSAAVTRLAGAGGFGTAYYLCIPLAIATVLCGVWLFLVKRKEKSMACAMAA